MPANFNADDWQTRNARLRRAYEWASNYGAQGSPPPSDIADFFNYNDRSFMEGNESRWELRPEFQQEFVGANDPRVQAWLGSQGERQFLDENGRPIAQDDGSGRYVISANYRYEDLAQDPSFRGMLPDGRAIFDRNNAQSWEVDDQQRAEETENRRGWQQYVRIIAAMAAPVAASYAFPAAFAGAGSPMGAAMGEGFGTLGAAGTAGATGMGATTATGLGAGGAVAPVGTLGSGTTLAGTGLGGSWGALGSGTNLTGTGLIGGTGATLAGTGVSGASAVGGMGGLAGLGAATAAGGTGAGGVGLAEGINTSLLSPVESPSLVNGGNLAPLPGSGLSGFLSANGSNLARLGLAGLSAAGSSGSSGNSSGTPTDVNDIIERMANANRVNHSTPLGSRQWTQDANGRWSVADTMNPNEQANFENVQGMNADVTGMARQRLAALLANPSQRARADAPLNVRFGG